MRGFSLIEVIMVVSIMAILAAIAIPGISDMAAKRSAAIEVEKVRVEIEKARDDARARLRCIHVTSPTPSTLQIDELAPVASGCSNTVATTVTKQFNAKAVDITGPVDFIFTTSGSLQATTDPVFFVSGKYNTISEPHQFKIFRLLGLVRKLS